MVGIRSNSIPPAVNAAIEIVVMMAFTRFGSSAMAANASSDLDPNSPRVANSSIATSGSSRSVPMTMRIVHRAADRPRAVVIGATGPPGAARGRTVP